MSDPYPADPAPRPVPSKTLKRVGIGAAIVAAGIVAFGITSRTTAGHELAEVAGDAAVPTVSVIRPERPKGTDGLVLPGTVQAFNSAAIYARTNGYVRRWLVDIGDPVRAGQPLAVLDAPEIDQQLAQARADYQTALAEQSLARSTADRWRVLLGKDAVSKQETDEKIGDLAAKSAVTNAQLANVKRLQALRGFGQLTAPFSGVVTSRSAQIGALVTAGSSSAQPLFTVSDVSRVRVFVRVPQIFSAQVTPGLHGSMTLPEFAGRSFDVVTTRTAGAVEAQSGTVLVELQAPNGDRALKPGAYAQVKFPITGSSNSFRVPASVLMFGDAGPTLAIVQPDGRILVKPVTLGRDEGKVVEVTAGLTGGERIVDTPPDALATGDRVRVEAPRARS
jgi:RND family efflux transporter MFP subunit